MNYQVFILRRAQKQLASLPHQAFLRCRTAIESLADNPRPRGCRKLTGRDAWRIRVGDYRIIYEINDASRQVTVTNVDDRKDAYR